MRKKTQKTRVTYHYGFTFPSSARVFGRVIPSRGGSRQLYRIGRDGETARWSATSGDWESCHRDANAVACDLPARTHSLKAALKWFDGAPRFGKPGTTEYSSNPRFRLVLVDFDKPGTLTNPRQECLASFDNHRLLRRFHSAVIATIIDNDRV